jgi:hypothetical protein
MMRPVEELVAFCFGVGAAFSFLALVFLVSELLLR